MADMLTIARSGVLAAQTQMGVTSNNIANVGTDGYSRQVAEQLSYQPERLGDSFLGNGAYVADVKRIYNEFAQRELSLSISQHSQAATSYGKLSELDQLLSTSGTAVPTSLDGLFESFSALSDNPTDLGLRQNSLTSAGQLANAFQTLGQQLDAQHAQVNEQIDATVERVNALSNELANVNLALEQVEGQDPNLLDQQDRLINEMSELVQITTVDQANGVKSVMAGGSLMLVAGATPVALGTVAGDPDVGETRLTVISGNQQSLLSDSALGGSLQALMDYRDQDLAEAGRQLDLMALGVAHGFNEGQAQGYDLDGQPGQPLFTEVNSPALSYGRAAAFADNTGSGQVAVEISDPKALTGGQYQLAYDGTSLNLTDESGAAVALTQDATDPSVFHGPEGFSVRLDTTRGPIQAGDAWQLTPTQGAAATMEMTLEDPKGLAGAGHGQSAFPGEGDNSNFLHLASLATEKTMKGGRSTFADVFEGATTQVGGQTKAAEVAMETAEIVQTQAEARVSSESGVNLDEEAANLMRFQQAYQASARIMAAAQETFDTLMNAVR